MKLNMKNIDEILRYFPNKIYQIFFNLFQENSKIAEELQETINTFVRALPEREGNVFIRRYFYSDSIKDISVRYRMSENNIRVMLNRTRNKLRDRLEKEGYLS